ncbi:MAG: choice-of-anchor L domain-containing protein [Myxococcota bacterium]|nr:choice-of-anchor L domain-containing protein [Myxococcota bacterium]
MRHLPRRAICVIRALGLLALSLSQACDSSPGDAQESLVCQPSCGANQRCAEAQCLCAPGFNDCDGLADNGCERAGACVCQHGAVESCYSGMEGTADVGRCVAGRRSCFGGAWTVCEGEVVPGVEVCADGVDNDCDGVVDEDDDLDGDGFGRCSGDCCDDPSVCGDPASVNPAAFDFPDNGQDDDCDGSEVTAATSLCEQPSVLSGATAYDLAAAMELCQRTTDDQPAWGLLSAELTQVQPGSLPQDTQVAVLEGFGGNRQPPRAGASLTVLTTGLARGVGDPGYQGDRSILAVEGRVAAPEDYLAANEGRLLTNPQCPEAETSVYDSVRLALRIRVPSNAFGLRFDFRFWSREYPDFLCTEFNDFFLVRLRSEHPAIPQDRNISFDAQGNPVTVNSAFFTTCEALACDDPIQWGLRPRRDLDEDGCVDSLSCDEEGTCAGLQGACPDGSEDLAAYTLDVRSAGATSWLTTSAPVVPGELIELEFLLWDSSDGNLDSLVLLDNFAWVTPEPPLDTKR